MSRTAGLRGIYIATDYFTTLLAIVAFNIVRYYMLSVNEYSSVGEFLLNHSVLIGCAVIPPAMLLLYAISGYYVSVFHKSRADEFVNTLVITFVGAILIFFCVVVNDPIEEKQEFYIITLILWALLGIFVYLGRLIITSINASRIHNRKLSENTLVVGASQSAIQLTDRLNSLKKSMGFNIIGYINPTDDETMGRTSLPVWGIESLEQIIKENDVKSLIVVPHRNGMKSTMDLISSLFPYGISIYVQPGLFHLISGRPGFSNVAGEPLIDISRSHISSFTASIKRFFDIIISLLALIVLIPVFGIISLLIKLDSRGDIFYRQERIGYHKRPFKIIKFRTMTDDAESNGPALSSTNDPRVTRVGRFLRKYRLDELPQFWNVVVGQMSIVGPRPERAFYINQIIKQAPYYALVHQVRPGITSWGMVKYGYATTVEQMIERLRYDLLYIENVSLALDLKIIFFTVRTVLTGKGV